MTNLVCSKIAKGVTFLLYPQDGLFQKKAFGIMIQKISYLKLRGSWGQNGSDANLENGDIQVYKTVDGVASVVYEGVSG
jgi:hypothetical protein